MSTPRSSLRSVMFCRAPLPMTGKTRRVAPSSMTFARSSAIRTEIPAARPVSRSTTPRFTTPNSRAVTALAPPTSRLSNAELTELLHHGDALLRNGDVASARLFYERAAGAGDARAALRLGATFDPEFLGRLGLGKLQADAAEARSWYNRARDLGEIDAKRRLNSLETRQGE